METRVINAFSVYEKNLDINYSELEVSGQEEEEEDDETVANAFVIKAALFNHDCDENTGWTVASNGVQTLKTWQNIEKGEQITVNYGYFQDAYTWPERQEGLWNTYRFKCACQTCEEEKEQYRGIPQYAHLFQQQ